MKKVLSIEGMQCNHCKASVEKALSAVPGVTGVTVSLEDKNAVVTMSEAVDDAVLAKAVTDADFTVVSVSEA